MHSTGTFPIPLTNACSVLCVFGLVFSVRTTSTSCPVGSRVVSPDRPSNEGGAQPNERTFITPAGLKKCRPPNCESRWEETDEAIEVMERDEVFEVTFEKGIQVRWCGGDGEGEVRLGDR